MFAASAALVTFLGYASGHSRAEYVQIGGDARNFLPLPTLVAALVYLGARGARRSEATSWAIAGLIFGALVASWWRNPILLALVAAPAMALGATAGRKISAVLRVPMPAAVRASLAFAICTPVALGCVDLALRAANP